jgi:ribose 5-phosphate isomerase A
MTPDEMKRAVAVHTVETYIKSGLKIGLGSGSTAEMFVQELGARVIAGQLQRLTCVSTSDKVSLLAESVGLSVVDLNDVDSLDITVDGADEIDPKTFNLIKGRGAALLREKLVASTSRLEIIIADESKIVNQIGEKMPLPVEVVPFGWTHTCRRLQEIGANPLLRPLTPGGDAILDPFITDNGNYILDCHYHAIEFPALVSEQVKNIIGVVEHGLFIGMVDKVIIGGATGVYELPPPS